MVGKNHYGDTDKQFAWVYLIILLLQVPGPGAYEGNTQYNLRSNPAWKIGTSCRDDDLKRVKREGYPGPGIYIILIYF